MCSTDIPNGQQRQSPRHLSVSFGGVHNDRSQYRSISPASSIHTIVEGSDESDGGKPPAPIKRRRTAIVDVDVTWWDLIKDLFLGPNSVRQKLAVSVTTAELEDADIDMFDHKPNPFIQTVIVFPCRESEGNQRHEAQCILDTGNLQGNIISAKLAKQLGFTSYEQLNEREKIGGAVMSGHIHTVIGAVHVSWTAHTSPQVYRNMRFLVSETAEVDLVIGNHSITRHRLLSPPNFSTGKDFIDIDVASNKEQLNDDTLFPISTWVKTH